MKKRALSMLLALTLCFTVLAGVGLAAPQVNVADNIDRLDNVLTNKATEDQQQKIQDARDDFYKAYPDGITYDGVWKGIIDRLVTEEVLENPTSEDYDLTSDDTTVIPYFFMRWLDDRYNGIPTDVTDNNLEDYPLVKALAKEFDELNKEINVAYVGPKGAQTEFDKYSEALGNKFKDFMNDEQSQLEILLYIGAIDEVVVDNTFVNDDGEEITLDQLLDIMKEMDFSDLQEALDYLADHMEGEVENTFTFDDAVAAVKEIGQDQVYVEVAELLNAVADLVLSTASEDYTYGNKNGNIYKAYDALYHSDELKKNACILIGMDIVNLVNETGIVSQLRDYATGKGLSQIIKKYDHQIFSGDKAESEAGVYALTDELVGILDEDLANEDAPAIIKKGVDELEKIGFTVDDLYDLAKDIVDLIDESKDVRNIWFNLGLGLVVDVVDDGVNYEDPTDLAQNLKYDFDNKFIANYKSYVEQYQELLDSRSKQWFYLALDGAVETELGTAVDVNGVTVELIQSSGQFLLSYDATKIPEGTKIYGTIYRGPEAVKDGDDTVDRYVKRVEITLKHIDVPAKVKSVEIKTPAGDTFASGDVITISGTSANIELISIYIQAPGAEKFLYDTVSAAGFAKGVIYKLPDNAVYGEYKVYAGDSEVVAESNFYVGTKAQLVSEQQFKAITKARNTKFENLGLPTEIEIYGEDGEVVVVGEVTWDPDTYLASSTKTQTVEGTYTINGYSATDGVWPAAITDIYDVAEAVDGLTTIDVKRGGNGGTTSVETYANYIYEEMHYNKELETVTVKGETNLVRVVIDLQSPNGTILKSQTVERAPFINGFEYDLSDVEIGEGNYTLLLKDTTANSKIYDRYTFNTSKVGELFTTDHVNYLMGFEDGTVRPNDYVTRDEVAAMLFRLLNDNARKQYLTASTDKFSDLESDRWSMTPIATLTTAGIINGYVDGTFGVGKEITRAEFAALCSRFGITEEITAANPYSDITGSWAEKEIIAVTAKGWFQGADGQFRPDDKLTRAEAVTVINRILGRANLNAESFGDNSIVEFSDLDADAWYYLAIVEASNAHDYDIINGVEKWTAKEEIIDWTEYEN